MVIQKKITNIIIAGTGGQGNLFASKVLAQAALHKGLEIKIAESYGVAQRGGSVSSQIRIGEGQFGPLVPKYGADAILGLEPLETLRFSLDFINPTCTIIFNTRQNTPLQAKTGKGPSLSLDETEKYLNQLNPKKVFPLDAFKLAKDTGNAWLLNMVMVGALIGTGSIPLSLEDINHVAENLSPPEILVLNLKAIQTGFDQITKLTG